MATRNAKNWLESVILDEDNMISDSATDVASQQSIKAFVEARDYNMYERSASFTVQNSELPGHYWMDGYIYEPTITVPVPSADNKGKLLSVARKGSAQVVLDFQSTYLNGEQRYYLLRSLYDSAIFMSDGVSKWFSLADDDDSLSRIRIDTKFAGTYNLTQGDLRSCFAFDTSSGSVTVNLPQIYPSADSHIYGHRFMFYVLDSTNTITVNCDAADTILGGSSFQIEAGTEECGPYSFIAIDSRTGAGGSHEWLYADNYCASKQYTDDNKFTGFPIVYRPTSPTSVYFANTDMGTVQYFDTDTTKYTTYLPETSTTNAGKLIIVKRSGNEPVDVRPFPGSDNTVCNMTNFRLNDDKEAGIFVSNGLTASAGDWVIVNQIDSVLQRVPIQSWLVGGTHTIEKSTLGYMHIHKGTTALTLNLPQIHGSEFLDGARIQFHNSDLSSFTDMTINAYSGDFIVTQDDLSGLTTSYTLEPNQFVEFVANDSQFWLQLGTTEITKFAQVQLPVKLDDYNTNTITPERNAAIAAIDGLIPYDMQQKDQGDSPITAAFGQTIFFDEAVSGDLTVINLPNAAVTDIGKRIDLIIYRNQGAITLQCDATDLFTTNSGTSYTITASSNHRRYQLVVVPGPSTLEWEIMNLAFV